MQCVLTLSDEQNINNCIILNGYYKDIFNVSSDNENINLYLNQYNFNFRKLHLFYRILKSLFILFINIIDNNNLTFILINDLIKTYNLLKINALEDFYVYVNKF